MICDAHVSQHSFGRFQVYFQIRESLHVLLCSAMPSKNLDEKFVNRNVLNFYQHCIQGKRASMHEQKLDVLDVLDAGHSVFPHDKLIHSWPTKRKDAPKNRVCMIDQWKSYDIALIFFVVSFFEDGVGWGMCWRWREKRREVIGSLLEVRRRCSIREGPATAPSPSQTIGEELIWFLPDFSQGCFSKWSAINPPLIPLYVYR